ncbi:MAG: DUF4910 domain-containing protein [Rhodospirillales bacterium]|nr:DUF4910 domain-containing protein [Rhodospirillales bacterium]
MTEDNYEVVIDSTLEPGSLDYCETRIGPATGPEILISTYCCHPSLANNELSGPILTAFLGDHLSRIEGLSFGYRVLFLPETIGSIAYLSKHGAEMVKQMQAGYVISCVGDDGPYTYMKSRRGDSAADIAAAHMLKYHVPAGIDVNIHDFAPDSGGDERQFNSPGFNLPVGSLLRSYPGEYREYHNSHDNLEYVSAKAMSDSLVAYLRIMQTHEMNRIFLNTNPNGEPQLGRRGLYPSVGVHPKFEDQLRYLLYLLCYGDGEHDLMAIANKLDRPVWVFTEAIEKLMSAGLLIHAP